MTNRKCPKKEGALASNEFISKYKIRCEQNLMPGEECDGLEELMESAHLSEEPDESQRKPNGRM